MRIGRLGEFGAIARIKSLCRPAGRAVRAGIGDDAAAYMPPAGLALVTSDMMVEGVHFDAGLTGWLDLGYKALASNLSDIAAMGGRPLYYLVSVAFRGDEDVRSLEELYAGLEEAAGPHGVRLIGGDTTATPGARVVSVTLIGEAGPRGPVRRSGARPGDDIYVTGTLGDSAAGLEILKSGGRAHLTGKGGRGYLVMRHLRPAARVKAGILLGGLATSMIDVSDGFSSDLGHILEQSGAGARVEADKLPLSGELLAYAGRKRALGLALDGGEDYELIFTAGPRARKKITGICGGLGVDITMVGEVARDRGAYLVAGKGAVKKLRPGGYEHFTR